LKHWTIATALGLRPNEIEAALVALDAAEAEHLTEVVRLRTIRNLLLARLMAPSSSNLHAVDLAEAARILGESDDWIQHHGHEADEYGAAIRMGGSRISGYDVEGLSAGAARKRRTRTVGAPGASHLAKEILLAMLICAYAPAPWRRGSRGTSGRQCGCRRTSGSARRSLP